MTALFQVPEKKVSNWTELVKWLDRLPESKAGCSRQWMFRGVSDASYPPESTLERAVLAMETLDSRNLPKEERARVLSKGIDGSGVPQIEERLIREFKRRAHHYMPDVPDEEDQLEWLALMRHYGAPVRLLDWTHSFWVAVYFAIEKATDCCAIWALDLKWFEETIKKRILKPTERRLLALDPNVRRRKTFERVFASDARRKFALPVAPFRLNERHSIQQSIFLCPGDVTRSFCDNLEAVLHAGSYEAGEPPLAKLKVSLTSPSKKEFLQKLYRMNVTRASLFPDLGGFAGSLEYFLVWARFFPRPTARL